MNRQILATELVKIAKSLISIEFPTQDAYDKYMKEHPDADKSLHKVVETKKEPAKKEKPGEGGGSASEQASGAALKASEHAYNQEGKESHEHAAKLHRHAAKLLRQEGQEERAKAHETHAHAHEIMAEKLGKGKGKTPSVAKELLAIASELVEADSNLPHLELKQLDREAGVFPSQKALQEYMREHPDSERAKHKVDYKEWKRKYRD